MGTRELGKGQDLFLYRNLLQELTRAPGMTEPPPKYSPALIPHAGPRLQNMTDDIQTTAAHEAVGVYLKKEAKWVFQKQNESEQSD